MSRPDDILGLHDRKLKVFLYEVLREETERVGELQTGKEEAALSDTALASGAEGVKEAIHGFSDA